MVENKKKKEEEKNLGLISSFDLSKGVYSNFAVIHHTDQEFAVDFFLQFGNNAQLVSRVIMSPEQIKKLNKAIEDNIKKFETKKPRAVKHNNRIKAD